MAVFQIARYAVRPDARVDAERAMHDFAAYVRSELPESAWSSYRGETHYLSLVRAESPAAAERHRTAPGTQAFAEALAPLLVGEIEVSDYQLVTSSDLARRFKPSRGRSKR